MPYSQALAPRKCVPWHLGGWGYRHITKGKRERAEMQYICFGICGHDAYSNVFVGIITSSLKAPYNLEKKNTSLAREDVFYSPYGRVAYK